MREELARIKEEHVAWTIDELEDGLLSVAVSLPDIEPNQHVAVYLSAPTFRFIEPEDRAQLARDMLEMADVIMVRVKDG